MGEADSVWRAVPGGGGGAGGGLTGPHYFILDALDREQRCPVLEARFEVPCDKPTLAVTYYNDDDPEEMRAFLLEEPDSVALVCVAVPLWKARAILPPSREKSRWSVPSDRIPALNRLLTNTVVIVGRRDTEGPVDAGDQGSGGRGG